MTQNMNLSNSQQNILISIYLQVSNSQHYIIKSIYLQVSNSQLHRWIKDNCKGPQLVSIMMNYKMIINN